MVSIEGSFESTVKASVNMEGCAFSTFARFIVSCCSEGTTVESMPRSKIRQYRLVECYTGEEVHRVGRGSSFRFRLRRIIAAEEAIP